MRVLVCGSREWNDSSKICVEIAKLPCDAIIIHGDCKGVDRMAGNYATNVGRKVEKFPADWHKYGRSAGPIRNQQMLDDGKPDLVLAFSVYKPIRGGTLDMVTRARKAGIEVREFYAEVTPERALEIVARGQVEHMHLEFEAGKELPFSVDAIE